MPDHAVSAVALTLALAAAAPTAADEIAYRFAWYGANGYRMTGAMSFDAELAQAALVTEDDVRCFEIEGFHRGAPIGRWALGMLTPETSWLLHFDPRAERFLVGATSDRHLQAWNMNFRGDDCGIGGFGFNIGSAAQDICLDDALIVASQVPPPRPLPAIRAEVDFPPDACRPPDLVSELRR